MTFQQSLPLGRPRARRLAGAAALALAMGLSSYALADDSAAAGYAFEQGFPTPAATRQARDDADFARAVTAYRFWYPTVSTEGIFDGMRSSGIEDNVSVAIAVAKPDLNLFTANSDTPYGGAVIDVSSGPMVIEIPPGPYIGFVDDHNQRWVFDFGLPGADAGRGRDSRRGLRCRPETLCGSAGCVLSGVCLALLLFRAFNFTWLCS